MPILELRQLTKKFGGLTAVGDLDLNVKEGEIAGLIGPNGAGKTTVFNVISGVLPPTSGTILFKGEDITGLKPHRVAQKGLVRTFQLTTLFSEMTTMQNILLGFHLKSGIGFWSGLFSTPSARANEKRMLEEAAAIADSLGLAGVRNELAVNLPHGHQRALGIAIALAAGSDLLMLDEPVTGMNPIETDAMMRNIRNIRDRGKTILLVEHDMRAVMGICERIYVISFGRKIAEGTPKEISENEQVIKAYLGTDYAAKY